MELPKELLDAVNYEISKDIRWEAELILLLTTDKNRQDFLEYHQKDRGNLCCLVLDYAKRELVKEKKMIQNDNDSFGNPEDISTASSGRRYHNVPKELDVDTWDRMTVNERLKYKNLLIDKK